MEKIDFEVGLGRWLSIETRSQGNSVIKDAR